MRQKTEKPEELNTLSELREMIDSLDADLLRILNLRARCAKRVGEIKKQEDDEGIYYRPEREAQVLRRLQDLNQGPLPNDEVKRLFREVMSACLALEKRLRIAYLGPPGTFTQAAVFKQFGHSVISEEQRGIGDVFRAVESGRCHYGLTPVENTTEGVVNHTLDCFLQSDLSICGEVQLRIRQHLLSQAERLDAIKRVYSHAQSLSQCRQWLNEYLPTVEQITVSSNAEAAKRVVNDREAAAIAGKIAADQYGLPILAAHIEDQHNNTTRFLIIGRQYAKPSGNDRTSLLVSAHNQPGLLYRLLEPISRHSVNMTRIESRPSRQGMWEYVFFMDLDGHCEDGNLKALLEEMREKASLFRILGSYPKSIL